MDDQLPDALEIDPKSLPSAILRQLIAEIQQEDAEQREAETVRTDTLMGPYACNRTHNRHNRGTGPSPWERQQPGYNRTHNRHNRGR